MISRWKITNLFLIFCLKILILFEAYVITLSNFGCFWYMRAETRNHHLDYMHQYNLISLMKSFTGNFFIVLRTTKTIAIWQTHKLNKHKISKALMSVFTRFKEAFNEHIHYNKSYYYPIVYNFAFSSDW